MKIDVPQNGEQYAQLGMWEASFRGQAALLALKPPPGVDPQFVNIQIDSFLSLANEMAEARSAYRLRT